MRRLAVILAALVALSGAAAAKAAAPFTPGSLVVLPQDGRTVYTQAFAAAQSEIRIEICVLEDPAVLRDLQAAIGRGVRVRVIVDGGKYRSLAKERANLATHLTGAGGLLRLSNPVFPRSFPKFILIDGARAIVGSACLDSTTFAHYRDYAYVSDTPALVANLSRLFENDWGFSRPPGQTAPPFVPTPPITAAGLMVAPVNASSGLVGFFQSARRTLDVTSELVGNPTLEAELLAAVARGVRVRLISPRVVNGGSAAVQALQTSSLRALRAGGVQVHVTLRPETAARPYMHARSAVADGRRAYLGSISLSPHSATVNREVGLLLPGGRAVARIRAQFASDFGTRSRPF